MGSNNLSVVEHKISQLSSVHYGCNVNNTIILLNASDVNIETYLYGPAEKYIILIFYPITIVFGLISNLAFLAVVLKCPSMRTTTNCYLSNLAVADLLFISTVSYHFFVSYILSSDVKLLFYHSSTGCAVNVTLQFMSHFTAIALVVLVTVERYMCICHAVQHRRISSRKLTIRLITVAWTFGLIYSVTLVSPTYFRFDWTCILWPDKEHYEELPVVLTTCTPIHPFYEHTPLIIQPIPYISALVANCIMYLLIIKTLRKRDTRYTSKNQHTAGSLRSKRSSNITRLLIANACSFFICYSPFYFTRVQYALTDLSVGNVGISVNRIERGVVNWAAVLLSLVNSVMNPVIYNIASPQYRQAFAKVFTCKTKQRLSRNNAAARKRFNDVLNVTDIYSITNPDKEITAKRTINQGIITTNL